VPFLRCYLHREQTVGDGKRSNKACAEKKETPALSGMIRAGEGYKASPRDLICRSEQYSGMIRSRAGAKSGRTTPYGQNNLPSYKVYSVHNMRSVVRAKLPYTTAQLARNRPKSVSQVARIEITSSLVWSAYTVMTHINDDER